MATARRSTSELEHTGGVFIPADLSTRRTVRTTRAALPALAKARGAVVNISSSSARDPHNAPLPYAAAKAALNTFTRGLAEATAQTGMEFSDLVATPPQQIGVLTDELIDPDEIARAMVLVASPTMPSAVGSNWTVHGGAMKTA